MSLYSKIAEFCGSRTLDDHIIELRPYLKNEKTHLRLNPQGAWADVRSFDMAHQLWGMLELRDLEKRVFGMFLVPHRAPLAGEAK
uniref:Uncharacterized protein n=1 Tax=Romanomermis culicivorax TaxID=13658 RepID=A0A915IR12_ROMCU